MKNEIEPTDMNNSGEIDLVYTWVDGSDPAWITRHNAITGKTDNNSGGNCKGRYANNDELKYSLRSIEKYAPWIRRIFIVTDAQIPEWLNTDNPKIRIVDHKEIMPSESLPCFNSQVIEHCLYRIPGLSEKFLYANDDMFINRPVAPETFFASDGFPIIRMNRRPFRKLTLMFKEKVMGKQISGYNKAIQMAARLVKEKYGIYFGCKTHHNIDAYLKSDYIHVRKVFGKDIDPTLINHLRSANDVQRNIYSYVPLAEKRGHLKYVTSKTSLRLHIEKESYAKLEKYNPVFFCMNDSEGVSDADRKRASEFLRKRFPEKSQFELGNGTII